MTSHDLHDRLEVLFHEAEGLPPSARALLLARVRAEDVELARELEGLLAVEPHSDAMIARLGQAVPQLDATSDGPESPPGMLIGRTLAHYRVEELLGVGGMGEVYLATDMALGRPAALKVLKPERTEAAPHFRREVTTTARLQHPAIATFYEVGEDDGILFLAMEHVPGHTLRARLEEGPLDAEQAVSIAMTLLEAVSHAHTVGVVHRDIKPENIILTEAGDTKLMDFGIAKALEGENPRAPDEVGQIVGTPGYMAPEQLSADSVDHRVDIFAIAAVLYELLAGRPAFPGDTGLQRMTVTSTHDPAALNVEPYGPRLDTILARGLSKEPADRYPSAGVMIEALRTLGVDLTPVHVTPTVAVAGFAPDGTDDDDAWLGYGIAQALYDALAARHDIDVVPQRVVGARVAEVSADATPDWGELGRALPCSWVVTGDHGRDGDQIRITVRVVESATGIEVSAQTMSGPVDALFDFQNRIVALTLQSVASGAKAILDRARTPAFAAYELFVRSRAPLRAGGKGDHRRAREYLEEAIRIDPQYADALAALAQTAAMEFIYNGRIETLEEAVGLASRALEVEPHHHLALTWLLYARARQGRAEEAATLAEHVMRVAPTDHNGPYFRGAIALAAGRPGEALPYLQRAIELEERHGLTWAALGWAHLELGDAASAGWCLDMAHTLELDEGANFRTGGTGALLAECLRRDGDLDGARRVAHEALERAERSDFVYRDTFRALALCSLGRTALERGDREAAAVAFRQAEQHIRGRPNALGSGFLLPQALAGAVRAGAAPDTRLDEALEILREQDGFNFETMWGASEAVALLELARACMTMGRKEQAADLHARAVQGESGEARQLSMKTESE